MPLSFARGASAQGPDIWLPPSWYHQEALRVSWHLLRDIDGGMSGEDFVRQAVEANVNTICFTAGGSFAFYPSKVPFHQRSTALPPGKDLVGEVMKAARSHGVRIISRFDFSKQPEATRNAHPEWFYMDRNGRITNRQGRFRPCLSAGFYRQVAPAIVSEVVERYRPDGIYINNFTNTIATGESEPCACISCRTAWDAASGGQPFPQKFTAEYLSFISDQGQETAKLIELPIRSAYPETLILNADSEPSDGLHLESRVVSAGMELWPYETAEATDRQLNSHPGKVGLNLCISYAGGARMLNMPPAETRVHMYQAIASGSHPGFSMMGTFAQYDRPALNAAKEVYAWHKANADLYVGQSNAARVLLLCRPSLNPRRRQSDAEISERGLYRLLSEQHIPVASSETNAPLLRRPDQYDVVIVSRGAPLEGLEDFVRRGGKAIFVDQHPGFAVPQPTGSMELDGAAYWRVRDRSLLPHMPAVEFLHAGGGGLVAIPPEYAPGLPKPKLSIYPPERDPTLTLVPPMFEELAEQTASNLRDTTTPGLIWRKVGRGRIAFIPWDLGGLYTRAYEATHADLFRAVMQALHPGPGEIETDAAATVQMLLMQQKSGRKTLHLVNLSGQTQRGYADPARTGPIRIGLRGKYGTVVSRALRRPLSASYADDRTVFTLPHLDNFDSVQFSA